MSRVALLVLVFMSTLSLIVAAPANDLIQSLPGYGKPKSAQYSGLIAVDDAGSAFLHYWFVSATTVDPATAPVSIWLNGGPGCSSLEGYMYELGPYTFVGTVDGDGVPVLMDNPQTWATVSNMLFIESPFGVGYSYAVNGSLSNNDDTTSQNTHGFLVNWYKAFPEYAKNDLFITGESYAGFYIPQLALRIYESNKAGQTTIPLVGFAVGNACVGEGGSCGRDKGSKISVNLYHGHGMISQSLYEQIIGTCGPNIDSNSTACRQLVQAAARQKGGVYVYDVYDTCGNELVTAPLHTLRAPSPFIEEFGGAVGDPIYCEQLASTLGDAFMNHPSVKAALHVDTVPVAANWTVCANVRYTRNTVTLIPLYKETLAEAYRILVYSGDADACVPWNGSEEWVRELNFTVSSPWTPWMTGIDSRQWTGGFFTVYATAPGLAFVTIKHAGHMVPQYEPEAGLTMFKAFINPESGPFFTAQISTQ